MGRGKRMGEEEGKGEEGEGEEGVAKMVQRSVAG